MTYNDVMNLVLSNPIDNWTCFDEFGEYVLKDDVNLRIVRCDFDEKTEFYEGWATNHPDNKAYMYTYTIFYNNSRIDRFDLVAVDGLRAHIPMPKMGTNNIPRREYNLARAVEDNARLDEYIKRSGLIVVD